MTSEEMVRALVYDMLLWHVEDDPMPTQSMDASVGRVGVWWDIVIDFKVTPDEGPHASCH